MIPRLLLQLQQTLAATAPEMVLTEMTLKIFSALEQQWLVNESNDSSSEQKKKARILSIDGGYGIPALTAAMASLLHLENLLQTITGNPDARVADFFDLIAGTGTGGILAILLTAGKNRRPVFSIRSAAELLLSHLRDSRRRRSILRCRRISRRSMEAVLKALRAALGSLTLRDAVKPLLVPCYDLLTGAPFVFSGAGAGKTGALDFELWKVCCATSATPGICEPFPMASIDGATVLVAVDGGLTMSNPASAAVTHVIHNNVDFPFAGGVEDLVLLSLGGGGQRKRRWLQRGGCRASEMEIAMKGLSDAVDQSIANAFPVNAGGYLRIQGNDIAATEEREEGELTEDGLKRAGERLMKEKGVESLPLGGKRMSTLTNGERLEEFARGWLVNAGPLTAAARRHRYLLTF